MNRAVHCNRGDTSRTWNSHSTWRCHSQLWRGAARRGEGRRAAAIFERHEPGRKEPKWVHISFPLSLVQTISQLGWVLSLLFSKFRSGALPLLAFWVNFSLTTALLTAEQVSTDCCERELEFGQNPVGNNIYIPRYFATRASKRVCKICKIYVRIDIYRAST